MNIPNLFKETIKNIFYDKELELWASGETTDDEGSTISSGKKEKKKDFKGNFQFSTREYIQTEYGKEIDADVIVTCDIEVNAEMGDMIIYEGQEYVIKANPKSDSHITLLAKGGNING